MKSYSVPEILRVPLEELCLHIMVSESNRFLLDVDLQLELIPSVREDPDRSRRNAFHRLRHVAN